MNEQYNTDVFGVNPTFDETDEEYHRHMGFGRADANEEDPICGNTWQAPADQSTKSIDWEEKGMMEPVKNQGMCGSCWAFSTVSILESRWMIAGNTGELFSEQYLVDCVYDVPDSCGTGGFMSEGFEFLMKGGSHADPDSAHYKYTSGSTGSQGSCKEAELQEDLRF